MFPYYGRFLPRDRRRQALNLLLQTDECYHNLLYRLKSKHVMRHLRYCPLCAAEDRERYTNHTDWMSKTHMQQWPAARFEYYDLYFANTGVVKQLKDASEFLEPYFYNEVMPHGFTFPSEQAVYDEYLTDITKYVAEKFAAWVTGEADVDAEWDAFQEQLKKLHVEELVAGYQAQYDRLIGK